MKKQVHLRIALAWAASASWSQQAQTPPSPAAGAFGDNKFWITPLHRRIHQGALGRAAASSKPESQGCGYIQRPGGVSVAFDVPANASGAG